MFDFICHNKYTFTCSVCFHFRHDNRDFPSFWAMWFWFWSKVYCSKMVFYETYIFYFLFFKLPFKVKLVFWQKLCFLVSLVKISINVFVNLLFKVKLTVAKCCFLVLLVIFRTHSFCSIFSCFHQPYRDFHSFSARLIKIWFICRIQIYNQIAGFSYFLLVLAVSPSAWL